MIRIGVDYYPEHWSPEWWEDDAREMARANIDTVRIGEFAWGVLEPSDGNFNFEWLDEVIAIFDRYNIDVILGTPTNCAPVWLYTKHTQTRQVGRDGNRTALGIRGHRCMTDPVFRRYAARIVTKMVSRYVNNPRVIAWQIDNEPEGNHCCCSACAEGFRAYLRGKYKTVDDINLAWGNDVWSGQYDDFESIMPPLGADYQYGWMNPAYLLDYEKWASVSCAEFLRFQRDIIKSFKPDAIVTTNACFNTNMPDFHAIFREYDFASYDNYPPVRIPDINVKSSQAFALDLVRGYKQQNFWILEQLSGPKGCWVPISPTTLPGMLKGYAWQTIARGADLLLFFRWRSARSGAEMFYHGLFDTKIPSGRRYAEFLDFVRELRAMPALFGTKVKSRVAILYSYIQDRAFRIQPQSEGFSYWEQLKLWHDGFLALGINIDVVGEDVALDGYDVIVAPAQFISNESLVNRLEAFTKAGGTVVLTNRTGVKAPDNNRITELLPNAFRKLAGCVVREYDPIGNLYQSIKMLSGQSFTVTRWCDVLEAETAKDFALYSDSFYKGGAAITVNTLGGGECYYVGTVGDRDFYRHMAKVILSGKGIPYYESIPVGVEISTRENDTTIWIFVFNNNESRQAINLFGEQYALSPFEMRIITRAKHV
ncbi:MAG: beta-galactosidase [Christensenellales bacterium]